MTILSDIEITQRCMSEDGLYLIDSMIEPFEPTNVSRDEDTGNRVISYGLSSYGYDIRLGNELKLFSNMNSCIADPKGLSSDSFVDLNKEDGDFVIIPPNSFLLGVSKEYIRVPRDILVQCIGKSTYARVGLICNVTPLEPEWKGQITLEFSNTTTLPVKMYIGEGCAQLLFHRATTLCRTSYADKGGKYQGQKGITLPR